MAWSASVDYSADQEIKFGVFKERAREREMEREREVGESEKPKCLGRTLLGQTVALSSLSSVVDYSSASEYRWVDSQ
ncbi:hypothetical protein ACOSQ3_019305 [Xanthoceras sorbifolium]